MTATELTLTGDLADRSFLDWICHRARLLDLAGHVTALGPRMVRVTVAGPSPLIDAMEMACSLGPTSVDVWGIEKREIDTAPNDKTFEKRDSREAPPII